MSQSVKKRALAMVCVALAMLSQACETPCQSTDDCETNFYCAEDLVCTSDCQNTSECNLGQVCSIGRCLQLGPPRIISISPSAGAQFDTVQSIEVEFSFVGTFALLRLERERGEDCIAFAPREIEVVGDQGGAPIKVVFENVPHLGEDFAYRLTAVGELGERVETIDYRSNNLEPTVETNADVENFFTGFDSTKHAYYELGIQLEHPADVVRARLRPRNAEATTLQTIALNQSLIEGAQVPASHGAQTIEVQIERESGVTTCQIDIEDTASHLGLEFALIHRSINGDADLNLSVVYENAAGAVESCTQSSQGELCSASSSNRGPEEFGDEILNFSAAPVGVYGIVVTPSISSAPVVAMIRVSRDGQHLGFIGPKTLNPSLGEEWVAGRVYLSANPVLDAFTNDFDGDRNDNPSTW